MQKIISLHNWRQLSGQLATLFHDAHAEATAPIQTGA